MQLDSRIFSSPPTDSLRRRLEPYNLPENAVNDAINAYLASASELRQLVVDAYTEMDTDEEREQLIGHYECHLETFADKVMEAVQDWESANPSRSTLEPIHTLPRDKRPLLEAYFLLNAHPDPKAKKALAEFEGITYRQVHTWFQNRRRRMKGFLPAYDAAVDVDELYQQTFGAPVLRENESPSPASCASQQDGTYQEERPGLARAEPLEKYTCQDWRVAYEQAPTATSHCPEEFMGEASEPLSLQSPVASNAHDDQPRRTTILRSAADRRRAKRHAPYVKDVSASLGAMNVRDASYDGLRGRRGYAAREAITYVAPRAPLPSCVSARKASTSSSIAVSEALLHTSRIGRPRRRSTGTRSISSESSSGRSLSSSSRASSFAFSDRSPSSSPASSPEPASPPGSSASSSSTSSIQEDMPCVSAVDVDTHDSRAQFGWAGGPERALPIRDEDCSPPHRDDDPSALADCASSVTSPVTMPVGLQGPDEGQHHPGNISLPDGHSDSALFSIDTTLGLPCPATSDMPQTVSNNDTAALTDRFGSYTTAMQKDGLIVLPNLDEFSLPDLDIDPYTLDGPLDINVATWDGYACTPESAPSPLERPVSNGITAPPHGADASSSTPTPSTPSQHFSQPFPRYSSGATFNSPYFAVDRQSDAFPYPFGLQHQGNACLPALPFGTPFDSSVSFSASSQVPFSFGTSLIAV